MNPIHLVNRHGSPTAPLVIDGGGDTIDAKRETWPVYLDGCSNFTLRDFNACRSNAEVIRIKDCWDFTIERICAWDAHPSDNRSVYGLHGSRRGQIVDCAGWGTGRKIFDASQGGDDVEWLRCFGQWQQSACQGPKTVFAIAYNNFRNTFRDCLGYVNKVPDEFTGIFAADRIDNNRPAQTLVDGCCGVSGNVCFAYHPTTVRGILCTNFLDYTAVQKKRASVEQLDRLRWIWERSPILDRIRTLSGCDPLRLLT